MSMQFYTDIKLLSLTVDLRYDFWLAVLLLRHTPDQGGPVLSPH